MSSGITVSGGATMAVAPDALYRHAAAIDNARFEASGCAWQLTGVGAGSASDAASLTLRNHTSAAISALGELESLAASTAASLRTAAEAYGFAEHSARAAMTEISARLGYAAGFFLPLAALALAPTLVPVAVPVALAVWLVPGLSGVLGDSLAGWLNDHRSELTDPTTLALLRLAISSTDDFGIGLAHVPPVVAEALREAQVTDVSTSAAFVALAAAPLGFLSESRVTSTVARRSKGDLPAKGLVDRFDRIPQPAGIDRGAQVRIDRLTTPGKTDRFEVFIAGTVDFNPRAGEQPWDMTSNVHAMGGLSAGSYRAVEDAMREAGVSRTSSVVFTGHSQGGLVAASLAASGDYATAGLVTTGAPTGHLDLPAGISAVAIEHTDDLVPALSGMRTDRDAVLVERRAFAPGAALPEDAPVPAHLRPAYRETAALADAASDPRLRETLREIDANSRGATSVETIYYRAEREQLSPPLSAGQRSRVGG